MWLRLSVDRIKPQDKLDLLYCQEMDFKRLVYYFKPNHVIVILLCVITLLVISKDDQCQCNDRNVNAVNKPTDIRMFKDVLEVLKSHGNFTKRGISGNASVIITPALKCREPHTFLIYVLSTPTNFIARNLVRSTYGNLTVYKSTTGRVFNIQLVFVLGVSNMTEGNYTRLAEEIYLHRDIWIGNFEDTYDNLTPKMINILLWTYQHCVVSFIDYIMKIHDDVLPNLVRILEDSWHERIASFADYDTYHFKCLRLVNVTVLRPKQTNVTKWAVTKRQYPAKTYPDYCHGAMYIITKTGFPLVIDGIKKTRPFPLEDVYMTALAPRSADYNGTLQYKSFKMKRVILGRGMLRRFIILMERNKLRRIHYAQGVPYELWEEAFKVYNTKRP